MDGRNLIRLEMGSRVLGFSRANPSDNPGLEAVVTRLEESVVRAKGLLTQEATGQQTEHASVLTKEELRAAITALMRVLLGVARPAAVEVPGVAAKIKVRGGRTGNLVFLASAQVALAQATEMRELFTKHGMPQGLLEELGALVAQFAVSLDEKEMGFRTHVGANANLDATVSDIMMIVKQLDALNRHRFRKDSERLGIWKAVRNVHWPHPVAGEAATQEPGKKDGAEPAA